MNTYRSQCFSGFPGDYLFFIAAREMMSSFSSENFADIFLNSTLFVLSSNNLSSELFRRALHKQNWIAAQRAHAQFNARILMSFLSLKRFVRCRKVTVS